MSNKKITIYCVIDSCEVLHENEIKFNWKVGIWKSFEHYEDLMKDHYVKGRWQFNNTDKPTEQSFDDKFIFEIKNRFIDQTPYEFNHKDNSFEDYKLKFIFNKIIGIENKIQLHKMYEKIYNDIGDDWFSDNIMPISLLPRIIEPNLNKGIQDILISTNNGLKIIDKYLFIKTYKINGN